MKRDELRKMHEGIDRKFAAGLSKMLRTPVEVNLTNVWVLRYAEFTFGLDIPTCFNILQVEPLEGCMILDIAASIMNPMVNRLIGDGQEQCTLPQTYRTLTDIEVRLLSRITNLFLAELKDAWKPVVELDFSVMKIECNLLLRQALPGNENVVQLEFEVALLGNRGHISLCIPFSFFEQIAEKLNTTVEEIKLLQNNIS